MFNKCFEYILSMINVIPHVYMYPGIGDMCHYGDVSVCPTYGRSRPVLKRGGLVVVLNS